MASLTIQYVLFVEKMKVINLELAADYLLMSAMLIEIKSRMLLPKPINDEEESEDPRAELVRRLVEYELIKSAALELSSIDQIGRDFMASNAYFKKISKESLPDVSANDLFQAWQNVLKRAKQNEQHDGNRHDRCHRCRCRHPADTKCNTCPACLLSRECVIPLRPLLSHVPWDDWVTVQPCDGCAEATGRLHVRASMSITATGDNTVHLTGFRSARQPTLAHCLVAHPCTAPLPHRTTAPRHHRPPHPRPMHAGDEQAV